MSRGMMRLAPAVLLVIAIACGAGMRIAAAAAAAAAAAPALTIELADGKTLSLAAADIAKLATTTHDISFETSHGPQHAVFDGPLLWALLEQSGALAGLEPRQQVGHVVIVTGRDGYQAAVALGEISPEFEGKPVILAERMDGAALGEEHLRLIVPGDRRAGRCAA